MWGVRRGEGRRGREVAREKSFYEKHDLSKASGIMLYFEYMSFIRNELVIVA